MLASVRAFLEQLIDYAGMFPPARLPLGEALQQYQQLSAEPEAWLLGRFVCTAANLDALATHPLPNGLDVAALGLGGAADEFGVHLDADLRCIHEFRTVAGCAVRTLDIPLPLGLTPEATAVIIAGLASRLAAANLAGFVELPPSPTWADEVRRVATLLTSSVPTLGLKIRCGGAAIPSVEQLAFFIGVCRDARLPWKATAGLHHPLRHRDPTTQAPAHGFLNVFTAGIFAHVHGLPDSQLTAILAEEAPAAFHFTDASLSWRDWHCTVEHIRQARHWLPSFGSCSFDEPRADLQSLGLLE